MDRFRALLDLLLGLLEGQQIHFWLFFPSASLVTRIHLFTLLFYSMICPNGQSSPRPPL